MNKVIRLQNIVKNYQVGNQSVFALRSVSLEVQKGEYVAIMGASGSGKSTLMNIIGCLDTPTSGSYHLNNTDVSGMNDDRLAEIRNSEIGCEGFLLPFLNQGSVTVPNGDIYLVYRSVYQTLSSVNIWLCN